MLGLGPILVRFSHQAGAEVIAFWRMAIAAPILFFFALRTKNTGSTKEKVAAFSAGIFLAADLSCWHIALLSTKVANATLPIGLSPFWVAFMSALYPGLKLSTRFFIALIICFAGMSLLTSVSGLAPQLGRGELLAIIASVFYAMYTYTFAMICKRIAPIHALKWSSLGSAFFMFLMALWFDQPLTGFSNQTWAALIGLGIFIQSFAWLLISKGLQFVHATVGSVGLLGQQVATVFFGWAILDEKLGAIQLIGCLVMLIGMAMGGRFAPRPKEIARELV